MSANQEVENKARKWMEYGETGLSSLCIAATLLHGNRGGISTEHPYDVADFRRCHQLLQRIPEFKVDLKKMSKVSPHWAALVERWDEVEKLYLSELPNNSFHGTYKLMQQIYNGLDHN